MLCDGGEKPRNGGDGGNELYGAVSTAHIGFIILEKTML
jgi:hypothetical protein